MEHTFGYIVVLGVVVAVIIGISFGAAIEYSPTEADFRTIAGLFIGWFVVVGMQKRKRT